MANAVYWCPSCRVPIIKHNKCTLCGGVCELISSGGVCNPVFEQERRLISKILEEDFNGADIWYLGSSYYLVDGKRTRLPYIDFCKSKRYLDIAPELRQNIVCDDDFPKKDLFVRANLQYLNEIVFEAEQYITSLVQELKQNELQSYVPTVSFSGGKDSTVVSRIVRDALQDESIIHYFGDTTLEFPCTHTYVEESFRAENPFTPMIPSETDNDFFKLCNVFGPPSRYERWCCTIFKTSTDLFREDFKPEVFQDPIALLDALKKKKKALNVSALEENDYLYEAEMSTDELLSMSDIERRYHVSIETVRSAIKTKVLVPVASIPLFSSVDVMKFIEDTKTSLSPIATMFLEEIEHMRINYSYKPLLLMAILEKAGENGEISMTDIIDYYFAFYKERGRTGLQPEKGDSTFVRYPDDRQIAKRTIATYPLKIYIGKGFLSYDPSTKVVKVDQTLWAYILDAGKEKIKAICEEALRKYYLAAFG